MSKKFKIEYMDPVSLVPFEDNAKIHDEQQIKDLAAAIEKRGFDQPITVDTDLVIITGHGRREAAIRAGLKQVPVIVRKDLAANEVRAKRLEDNRLASTDYDAIKLQRELEAIFSEECPVFGFDERELSVLVEDMTAKMDTDSLVDDLNRETERQREEHSSITAEVASGMTRIIDVLGFREIPMVDAITVGDLLAYMEEETGKEGAEAFVEYARMKTKVPDENE